MNYNTLCNWLTGLTDHTVDELHSIDHFRSILECERMRADRSGMSFSLAVFSPPAADENHDEWSLFDEHLQSRLRATDHAGHLEMGKIGVVLWDTQHAGAWIFIAQIVESWHGSSRPDCSVYLYPQERSTDLDNHRSSDDKTNQTIKVDDQTPETVPALPADSESLAIFFVRPLPTWKRLIDVTGAAFGLVALSPLMVLTALLVKLTSPGPIFFQQQRSGLGGEPFTIFKFRTMCLDADQRKAELQRLNEQDGPAFKIKNDPRITTTGRYLRKTCIDELPQLWNVLKGDMTLVGPRPLPCQETDQIDGWGRRRLEVTPGLTCIWQVYGKSRVSFTDWMRMDLRYIKARTLLRDVKLIGATLLAIVLHRASH